MTEERLAIPLEDLGRDDVPQVGGKNASLGEMIRHLRERGVRVPSGFATTARGYRLLLAENALEPRIRELTESFQRGEHTLAEAGKAIRGLFLEAKIPDSLADAIRCAYRDLGARLGRETPDVAVRSSATAEDLPEASFAGQQETFLNIRGEEALLDACRRCYASLFTDRAIAYREDQGFDQLDVALSVGVQTMVRADAGCSGVMFSLDTDTGFPRTVLINGAWGLGETVVLARGFAERFDGFSIGSNDLTQLALGVDRDSDRLAPLFDERNPAVKELIASVIASAQEAGRKVGLCGQAPSDHPDFAAFLVRCGIDSISVNPDSFLAVKRAVAEAEQTQ